MRIARQRRVAHRLFFACALVAGAWGADGCATARDGSERRRPPPASAWRSQAVALEVNGFSLVGGQAAKARWAGTGVWVADQVIATNAHVAERALEVRTRDDNGQRYLIDGILALRRELDIALLHVASPEHGPPA